jgi:hypothetical protein
MWPDKPLILGLRCDVARRNDSDKPVSTIEHNQAMHEVLLHDERRVRDRLIVVNAKAWFPFCGSSHFSEVLPFQRAKLGKKERINFEFLKLRAEGETPNKPLDLVRHRYSEFAPKATSRPSQSLTTNSREFHGVLARARVNSTPRGAYSAYSASTSSTNT